MNTVVMLSIGLVSILTDIKGGGLGSFRASDSLPIINVAEEYPKGDMMCSGEFKMGSIGKNKNLKVLLGLSFDDNVDIVTVRIVRFSFGMPETFMQTNGTKLKIIDKLMEPIGLTGTKRYDYKYDISDMMRGHFRGTFDISGYFRKKDKYLYLEYGYGSEGAIFTGQCGE